MLVYSFLSTASDSDRVEEGSKIEARLCEAVENLWLRYVEELTYQGKTG